ncbi:class I SAM-dependent methyltransferase [Alkalihalobacillus sp. TS-13]|uniref:class I SAM-dependent methyltransferase n=1 Tax=Alkalihalobacillus sp. TS-13 TaxID=2842455 RepID=UPI0028934D22|nr:class I SAM-dependent methyltransferase [Alkalihalobacillus sp. TS-13]
MKDLISFNAYEELADYYARFVDTKPFNAYYERPGTLSLLPDIEGKHVLDAGCGAGWYTEWFIKQSAAQITSIDFSPNMVKFTKKRVGDRAEVFQSDLNEPLDMIDDHSMDLIVSPLTLHYLKNWELPMREFNRILKDKGRLIFSVHHPFMDYVEFERDNYFATELLTDEWDTPDGKVEVQFFRRPLNEILKPLHLNGFVIEKLIEPMPTDEFKHAIPDKYEKLTKKPQFLFIRAQKTTDLNK